MKILQSLHDSPMAGHLARDKTIERFRQRFYLPRTYSEVVAHMNRCEVCQQAKSTPLAFAYNTAVHAPTVVSPFQMLYGRLPRLPIDLIFPS